MEAERRLCQTLGNGASARAEVLSFTRLWNRVLTQTGGLAEPVLDRGGRLLLMHQAVRAPVQPADPLRKALPEGSLFGAPDRHLGRTEELLRFAGGAGRRRGRGGQPGRPAPPGAGADSGLLRRADGRLAADPRDRLTSWRTS